MVLVFLLKVIGAKDPPKYSLVSGEIDDGSGHYNKGTIFDSMSIILTSYGFIINFYPVFSSLEVQSNDNGIKSTLLAMAFCFVAYLSFSHLGIMTYGEDVNPNIFVNISKEGASMMTLFIMFIFICIFVCNVPFVFLPGKESLLVLIDEFRYKTLSKDLSRRLERIKSKKGRGLQGGALLNHTLDNSKANMIDESLLDNNQH